ncbi:hypothetical protein ASPVEDRAFT_135759, partial [Aspergillus versicolor CBS 583.65]
GKVNSGYIAHPSFLALQDLAAIEAPSLFLLQVCFLEVDSIFTTSLRHMSEDALLGTGQPFQLNLFSGVSHGFAIRGDLDQGSVKFAKEQAFTQALAWFDYTLS